MEDSGSVARVFHIPVYPLCEFVDMFWYWKQTNLLEGLEYLLPGGTLELVLNLESESDSVLSGPQSRPRIIDGSFQGTGVNCLLGVHFKPGGIYPFLSIPVSELHNRQVSLEEIWGRSDSGQLFARLHDSDSVPGKFRVLETWLLDKLLREPVHSPAVNMAMASLHRNTALRTGDLIEATGLSQRRFIHVFQQETGLTPKLYARLCRFQKTLELIDTLDDPEWADLALACGYYDQPHFIHDFRKFSGITPGTYLEIRTEHRNHLPIVH